MLSLTRTFGRPVCRLFVSIPPRKTRSRTQKWAAYCSPRTWSTRQEIGRWSSGTHIRAALSSLLPTFLPRINPVSYKTDIPTDDTFYTDNGIELQKRYAQRLHRQLTPQKQGFTLIVAQWAVLCIRSRNTNQARSRAHIESSRAGAQETQYYPSISIAMLRHISQDLQFTVRLLPLRTSSFARWPLAHVVIVVVL